MSQSLLPSSLLNQLGGKGSETAAPSLRIDKEALIGKVLCILLVLLAALGPFIASETSEGANEGSSFRQISYLFVLGGLVAWAAPWRRGWRLISMPLPIIVALVWCWMSVTWAIEPGIAFRRLLLTTLMIWSVCIAVHRGGYRASTDSLRIALVIVLVLNYLTVWTMPEVGMHLGTDTAGTALAGNWRGVMTHKNFAGASCAMCLLLFLFDARHINLWIRGIVLLAASYFLYRSVSKTSMGMTVLAAGIGYGYNILSRRLRVLLIPVGIVVICVVATFVSAYLDSLGNTYLSPTAFTGRGQIWAALFRYLQDHALLGAGFGSFWNVGDSSPIFIYGHGYVTTVTVGHSGYLDLMCQVGVPGMLLIVSAVMLWPLIQIISSERISVEKGSLLCAMVLFCMGHNVTESSLFERDALTGMFAIFVAAFATYSLPRSRSKRGGNGSHSRKAGNQLMADVMARHKPR